MCGVKQGRRKQGKAKLVSSRRERAKKARANGKNVVDASHGDLMSTEWTSAPDDEGADDSAESSDDERNTLATIQLKWTEEARTACAPNFGINKGNGKSVATVDRRARHFRDLTAVGLANGSNLHHFFQSQAKYDLDIDPLDEYLPPRAAPTTLELHEAITLLCSMAEVKNSHIHSVGESQSAFDAVRTLATARYCI